MPSSPASRNTATASSDPPAAQLKWNALAVLATAIALGAYAGSFLPFMSDDAFISLRYAERLVTGHGLTWSDGPRVEGYTNLLWVLACAALRAPGIDLILAARFWGIAGMIAALAGIGWACRAGGVVAVLGAGLMFALSAPIGIWTFGGLEQPFVAALLAGALASMLAVLDESRIPRGAWMRASAALGLLCLSRADGGVLCVAVALGVVAARKMDRESLRAAARLAIFPLLLGGGQLLFRLCYYGEWVPNSARIKVALTPERVIAGLQYVWNAVPYMAGLIVPALAGLVAGCVDRSYRRRSVLLATVIVCWLTYVAFVGGDIFPGHRHWIPAVVVLALAVGQLLTIAGRWPCMPRRAVWLIVAAGATTMPFVQSKDPAVILAREERWEWDGQEVGELLRTAFGDRQPLLACDPAGCLPYFSRLPSIDMLGLNDHHIARHRRPEFGKGYLGHDVGDGKYVLSRRPDLVIFRLPAGTYEPLFPSGHDMFADPAFRREYRFVLLRTSGPRAVLAGVWMRVGSEKIGIRRDGRSTMIPGYLTAMAPATAAMLDPQGRLGAVVCEESVKLSGARAQTGRNRVRAESDVPCRVLVRAAGGGQPIAEGLSQVDFDVSEPGGVPIEIEIAAVDPKKPAHLREIVVTSPAP